MRAPSVLLALLPLAATPALAARAAAHPDYLHALTDLRAARYLLEHRAGDAAVTMRDDAATAQIDAALREIRMAAIDDGKNVGDHPGVDAPAYRIGRLHKAAELLRQAHGDITREEDDPRTRGLRDRAVVHVDDALRQTEAAIAEVERRR